MEISPSASTIIQTFQNTSAPAIPSKLSSPRTIIRTSNSSTLSSSAESSSTPQSITTSSFTSAIISVTATTAATASPLLVQTNGNSNNIETRISSSNNCGATVFIESKDEFKSTQHQVQDINKTNIKTQQLTVESNNNNKNQGHVVKILINPNSDNTEHQQTLPKYSTVQLIQSYEAINNQINTAKRNSNNKSIVNLTKDNESENKDKSTSTVRINVNHLDDPQHNGEMIKNTPTVIKHQHQQQQQQTPSQPAGNYFFYTGFQCSPTSLIMSSGQCSPSDTLDSGTCSDLDSTPPPLPKKKNSRNASSGSISVTQLNSAVKSRNHQCGQTNGVDSSGEDTESNISCDSLNSSELNNLNTSSNGSDVVKKNDTNMLAQHQTGGFPRGLLQDIRDRNCKLTTAVNATTTSPLQRDDNKLTSPPIVASVLEKSNVTVTNAKPLISESTYEERKLREKLSFPTNGDNEPISGSYLYEADRFYKFHLNENIIEECDKKSTDKCRLADYENDESFAGYKDLLGSDESTSSTIRSAKGTIRGVKNRVRAGIATFLQIQQPTVKSYREKDAGKVVVYTTTMGIVRDTYQKCVKVKQILRTHLVKFEERDVFMSSEYQAEIRDRMHSDQILVPQVYVDGQHIGDAETVERLNETGELRRILKPYKSPDACSTCQVCGGYRLLPCPVCNGSKKSVHRNHFTTEFVALKCMNCDEVGLVRCYAC